MLSFLSSLFFISYISNNAFPSHLTPEEEKYYFDDYTSTGNIDSKNILIERNLRLVAHVTKKYNYRDNEDLISIGTIGLIKAINTFKANKGVRLATYAARCIDNEILMHMRSNKKFSNDISLQSSIGVDNDGNEISLEDKLFDSKQDIDEQIHSKLQIKQIYELMRSLLKRREQVILQLRYGLLNGIEKTQKEIADIFGISRSYVSRIEKKAIDKLGKKMSVKSVFTKR